MGSAKRRPLRQYLVALVLVGLVPTGLLASLLTIALWQQQRDEVRQSLQESTREVALAVDLELTGSIQRLEALSTSKALRAGDFEDFYREAQRVMAVDQAWTNVTLITATGEQLVNLAVPYGAHLRRVQLREHLWRLQQTFFPVISDLFVAEESGRPVVDVAIPLLHNQQLEYVLSVSLDLKRFETLISAYDVRRDGIAAIFDGQKQLIARNRSGSAELGGWPSLSLLESLGRRTEGNVRLEDDGAPPIYAAWTKSPLSGWVVSVSIPAEPVEASLRRSLAVLAGVGLCVVVLVLVAALVLGRRIALSISRATAGAIALTEQRPVAPIDAPVFEVTALGEALEQASALLKRQSGERERAEAERRLLFEREQEARSHAEAANRAKDEFLAMLAHELRNPLGAIRMAVALLGTMDIDDPTASKAQEVIDRQAKHLARLVDDLLDVGRVIAGKASLTREPLELGEAARHAVETVFDGRPESRHAVCLDTQPAWVSGDPTRIEQVITNLITNAQRYTPAGGSIRVLVRAAGDEALLEVVDSGAGIEPQLLPHIFDLFVQGSQGLDRSRGGLGIGLTLVRRLVELHGGTIQAHSKGAGTGSTFSVRLPRVAAPSQSARAVQGARTSPAARRIVVVEDNADARDMLTRWLCLQGHDVRAAADGHEGLALVLAFSPEIALIDLGLPGIDGYELARRIRATVVGRSSLLIAVTGYGRPVDRASALDAGFDHHLVKPVNLERLRNIIADSVPQPSRVAATSPV